MNGGETNPLMAAALASVLRDGEIGFIGVGSSGRAHELVTGIPILAAALAQARGIDFELQIGPLIAPDLSKKPDEWLDNAIYQWPSPALMESDVNMEAFQRGMVSVGFVSGAQIDRFGNLNVNRIRTTDGWKRLGGALAVPEHCAFARRVAIIADLSPRTFVEEVDFVSGFGHRRGQSTRKSLGLPGGGPAVVVTDLALFDFEDGEMRLARLYPGVIPEQVEERMSFVPRRAPDLTELDPPSELEVRLINTPPLPALPY